MRVFLDTNVLVSAFATRGLCGDVLALAISEHEFLTAEVVIEEVGRVLRAKLNAPASVTEEAVAFLRNFHVEPPPRKLPVIALSDKSDIPVLGSALAARAQIFVTGDRELLALGETIPGLEILNPRGFWERISRERRRKR